MLDDNRVTLASLYALVANKFAKLLVAQQTASSQEIDLRILCVEDKLTKAKTRWRPLSEAELKELRLIKIPEMMG